MSKTKINLVFATVVLGMLMAALDQTIVSAALPSIVADLGSAGHMAWVVTSYLLAEAVATVLAGKLGDLFGRKLLFQISGIIFIAGSALAGMAGGMPMLILARGIQGVGAGGLMVTSMALIADTIPLRERGKYQGALGAVFGITTVLGPTLGGLFTDHASWRWCFYVNVPVVVVMLVMAARTLPKLAARTRPVIDYLGIGLVAVGVSALILGLEFGGNEYPWGSWQIIGLFVLAVVLLAAFVRVENRAKEPMLPMRLFRSRVFTVSSVLSFIVGFAMLGSMTYLPAYLQYVDGVSATVSGVRTLPLVVGLFITSIFSGQVVGKTGRYRYFPIVGMAVLAVGLGLMSTMDRHTSVWLESLYMLILGAGLGLGMQVLTIVVQNTVPYADLGTATSGVTFFRTLGSAFGTAVFGTLYSNESKTALAEAMRAAPGVPPEAVADPKLLRELPVEQTAPIVDAYARSIDHVFAWVVPVALLGFVVAWFLPQVRLRDSARHGAGDVGEGFSVPDSHDRVVQLERSVAATVRKARAKGPIIPELIAASGSRLSPDTAWALGQVYLYGKQDMPATVYGIAYRHRLPVEVLAPVFRQAADAGLLHAEAGTLALTDTGRTEVDTLRAGWRRWLGDRLDDWNCEDPTDRALLDEALSKIAAKLLDEGVDGDRGAKVYSG
ncbi:EmrB/QacA subfamily drug resistance transporter [Nocardia ignorata]|uniref:EmrB/QacA subfamily drug resistance transporter n=2 Tax=Nocardia ignorata TaxID=145285 RepID=A0A4R6NZW3_NOCIG|nr:EmrB/QacA subfamily drug resistance transporter [Nocardia ignorata]